MITHSNIEYLSCGHGGGWGRREETLTYNVNGVSFTPAEYEIYCLLQEVDKKLEDRK